MGSARPHPIPTAEVGQEIRYRMGNRAGAATVEQVAEGHGWPCYRLDANLWIGHEHLTQGKS